MCTTQDLRNVKKCAHITISIHIKYRFAETKGSAPGKQQRKKNLKHSHILVTRCVCTRATCGHMLCSLLLYYRATQPGGLKERARHVHTTWPINEVELKRSATHFAAINLWHRSWREASVVSEGVHGGWTELLVRWHFVGTTTIHMYHRAR